MDWNEVFQNRLAYLCGEVIRRRWREPIIVQDVNMGRQTEGYVPLCLAGWEWSIDVEGADTRFVSASIGSANDPFPTCLRVRTWDQGGEKGVFEIPLSTDVTSVVHQTMRQVAAAVDLWQ